MRRGALLALLVSNVAAGVSIAMSESYQWCALLNAVAAAWCWYRFRELNNQHRYSTYLRNQIADDMRDCPRCQEITALMIQHLRHDHTRPLQERIP